MYLCTLSAILYSRTGAREAITNADVIKQSEARAPRNEQRRVIINTDQRAEFLS